MKDIKFRAWREDIEVMEDVREMVWDNNGLKKQTGEQFLNIVGFREFESYTGAGDLKNVVLMQFTGLTDKNGKEIYEGDIVHQFPKEGYGSIVMNGKIGVVEFGYGAFHIRNINDHRTNFFFYTEQEVIGNIHEHKHLLKENG